MVAWLQEDGVSLPPASKYSAMHELTKTSQSNSDSNPDGEFLEDLAIENESRICI